MCEKRKAATEATASSNDSTNVSIFSESAQKLQKKNEEGMKKNAQKGSGEKTIHNLADAADFLATCDRTQYDPALLPDWFVENRVDMLAPPPPPEFLFSFGGVPVMPRGDLEIISGRPKRGKSMFVSLLLTALIGQREIAGIQPLRSLQETGRLLYLDTEASSFSAYANMERIFRTLGLRPCDLSPIGVEILKMRKMSRRERREHLAEALTIVRPSILIIDNLKDLLLAGLNDENLEFVDFLKKVSDTTYSIGVIHLNPGENVDKERGMFGSEMQQECGDTWRIDKNDAGYFTAAHSLVRYNEAPPINFRIDHMNRLAGVEASDIPLLAATNQAKKIFGASLTVTQKELYDAIKASDISSSSGEKKDKKAREKVAEWQELGLMFENEFDKSFTRNF